MILRPILQPVVRPLAAPFGSARRPTALTISQLLPAGAGRVAAIYTDPAKPSYDECIAKNMAAIAAGRPQDCVLFSALDVPVTYPIGAGQGKYLLKDRSGGGHDQLQVTASARGEFSRRYNMLTASEQFDDAYWTKQGVAVSPDSAVAPDGQQTADLLVESSGNEDHRVFNNAFIASTAAGAGYTLSVFVKDAGRELAYIQLVGTGAPAANNACVYNLTTLTAAPLPNVQGSISDAGNGWRKLTISCTSPAAGPLGTRIGPSLGAGTSYQGDGTSGIYIWGADLRLTADAIPSIPAYQRVTTVSDYDETGFPTYWRAVTDDWAKSHMDPNGATKAYVFWAGQKMSDAAVGILFELGVSTSGYDGSLLVAAPQSAGGGGNNYGVSSKGTVLSSAQKVGYAAPARSTLVSETDITNDIARLTVDRASPALSTTDQGTGTYLEYDVFFGARAGTSLFANIREYAPPTILFLQPTDSLSASHLAKLQKGYAKAVGVTL